MHNLLKQFIGNAQKDPLYDEIISEFQTLVNLRNDYLHGLWWTHESGTVFIQKENLNVFSLLARQEVTEDQFDSFLTQSNTLLGKIRQVQGVELRQSEMYRSHQANIKSSTEKPP